MDKIVLCGHTGSINRGCEAIIRSTARILNYKLPNIAINLASFAKHDDCALGIDSIIDDFIEYNTFSRYSLQNIKRAFLRRIMTDDYAAQAILQNDLWSSINSETICLNVGGDTYCYDRPIISYGLNEYCRRNRIKNIFWGCSVEESVIDEEMIADLDKYTLIIVRESISYENIRNVVNDKNKVKLFVDPAFALDIENMDLPLDFDKRDTVGLNLSPIVMQSGIKDIALLNYDNLVNYILDNSNMKIALIPHVYSLNNPQDLIPHRVLYEKYKHSNRIINIEQMYNCKQLKHIISCCRFFIGARTHATIAAYSTCVPTFVVGYSVKARGIARDIFGSEENMVMPVQSLENKDDLVNAFKYIQENEVSIRKHLQDSMPSYIEMAWAAGNEVRKLLEK